MHTPEDSPKLCPKCQAPIPEGAPAGLCPKCLMEEVASPTQLNSAPAEMPTLEEVAAAFPELEIVQVIGQGSMGIVFKVRQPRLERFAALKILPPHLAAQPDFAQRFIREARALARLSHPNIVGVYDFGEAGGFYYLMMEYIEGVNLREALRAERFTPEQALAVVPKLCEALQYAHDEGVLHRDIKPENILLDHKGRVKLADFGIAKLAGETVPATSITGTGATLGTPAYMAPEQIEKPGTVDHRADIYSLGVVFYEMLTGELPLGRFAAPSKKASLDSRIDDIVLRALEKERELRQQSATEMRNQVEDVTDHPEGGAPAPGEWQVRCTTCGRTRSLTDLGGIRIGAASIGKRILVDCSECGGLRFAAVERAGSTSPAPHYVSGPVPGRLRGLSRVAVILLTLAVCSGMMIPILIALGVRDPWFNPATCAAVISALAMAAMVCGVISALQSPPAAKASRPRNGWASWKICLIVAAFSLPIAILATMLILPMVLGARAPVVAAFVPLVLVPALTFIAAALVGGTYRGLVRRGSPVWLAVLICCALLLILGGSGIVGLLGVSMAAYQRAAIVPPAQQEIKVSATELGRLPATDDPGDRVAALDVEATPGCVVEGRFFIQRGEVSRELPDLAFGIQSDAAWGRWKTRIKVTADSSQAPTRFTSAVIGLHETGRGSERYENAPWPPAANWKPMRGGRSASLAASHDLQWEIFQGERTGFVAGEPENPAPASLVLRLTVHPLLASTPLQPFTFSIFGPRWWDQLSVPEPENRPTSAAVVAVDVDGVIVFQGEKVSPKELREQFAAIGLGKDAMVTVKADKAAAVSSVAEAVKAVEAIGTRVRVQTADPAEPAVEQPQPPRKS